MSNEWTVEERLLAIEESKMGASASAIAKRLGRSRNSVIGMLYRARGNEALPRPTTPRIKKQAPPPIKRLNKPKRSTAEKEEAIVFVIIPPSEKKQGNYTKFIYRKMGFECSFVIGESKGKDTLCCGNPVIDFSSWCEEHRNIVFYKRSDTK